MQFIINVPDGAAPLKPAALADVEKTIREAATNAVQAALAQSEKDAKAKDGSLTVNKVPGVDLSAYKLPKADGTLPVGNAAAGAFKLPKAEA